MRSEKNNRIHAETADPGVTLVIAGAGSGKTSTLINRAVSCIDSSLCRDDEILILAFNRSAAMEIKERLPEKKCKRISVYTFHGFCFFLLRKYSELFLKSSDFTTFPGIISDDNILKLVKNIIRRDVSEFRGLPDTVVLDILRHLDELSDWIRIKLIKSGIYQNILNLKNEIDCLKKQRCLITYDEIIELAIRFLDANIEIKKQVRDQYRFVLVDEFQDLSPSNFRLLSAILDDKNPNLFAVGDDWQSIYGFRDSEIDYIVNSRKYFSNLNIIKFKLNYRSKREIVSLSTSFIKNNKKRTVRKIYSARGRGAKITHYRVRTFEDELKILKRIVSPDKEVCSSKAVLFRNNWQGDRIKKYLGDDLASDISFMTFHKSKGLEFDSVIIAGVSDRIIPDRMTDIEEERRLLYVAITRAKDNLIFIFYEDEKGTLCRFGKELGF